MVPKKCYVFHKIVAVILLVMFIFVVPGAVFASDDMAEKMWKNHFYMKNMVDNMNVS